MKGLTRYLVFFFAVYLLVTMGLLFFTFDQQRTELIEETGKRLELEAEALSFEVARDFRMIKNGNYSTEEHQRHRENFIRRSQIFEYDYLFAFAQIDEEYVYVLEASEIYFLERDPRFLSVMRDREEITEIILTTYNEPKTVSLYINSDQWGHLLEAYSSIVYEDRVVGYIGISIDADQLVAGLYYDLFYKVMIHTAMNLIVVAIFFLVMQQRVIKPLNIAIRRLRQIASYDFADNLYGKSDAKRNDEIGEIFTVTRALRLNILELVRNMTDNAEEIARCTEELVEDDEYIPEKVRELLRLSKQNATLLLKLDQYVYPKEEFPGVIGTFTVNYEGTLLDANQGFEEISRKKAKDLLGHNIMDVLKGFNQGHLKRIIREGTSSFEIQLQGDELLRLHIEVIANDGQNGKIYGIVKDITSRVKWEERLKVSDARFSAFSNACEDWVFIKSDQGEYVFVNKAMEEANKRPHPELIGLTDFDLFHPEEAHRSRRYDHEVIERNKLITYNLDFDGKKYEVVKFPVQTRPREWSVGGFIKKK